MRIPSCLRALLAVCAISASLAACSDATAPNAASDLAPRKGRMLRPDQASLVKPGDFIVIRPEEYSKYGISTIPAPGGGFRSAMAEPRPTDCFLTAEGYNSCDPCYDQWGNPTYQYGCDPCYDQWGNPTYQHGCDPCYDQWGNPTYAPGCPQPVCYDKYGNVRDCNDPCYDQNNNYVCPTGPTGPPTQQNYNSVAQYDGQVNNGGILLKQIRLVSWSQGIQNVASFTVDAQFKNVGAAGGGCNGVAGAFDFATAYATGNGYIEVSRVAQWQGTIKWQVDGTHTFNPISGATGGGTFYTTSTFCG